MELKPESDSSLNKLHVGVGPSSNPLCKLCAPLLLAPPPSSLPSCSRLGGNCARGVGVGVSTSHVRQGGVSVVRHLWVSDSVSDQISLEKCRSGGVLVLADAWKMGCRGCECSGVGAWRRECRVPWRLVEILMVAGGWVGAGHICIGQWWYCGGDGAPPQRLAAMPQHVHVALAPDAPRRP
eukprot:scaffold1461_cov86-Phaeocystis_antarctica.AAC.2